MTSWLNKQNCHFSSECATASSSVNALEISSIVIRRTGRRRVSTVTLSQLLWLSSIRRGGQKKLDFAQSPPPEAAIYSATFIVCSSNSNSSKKANCIEDKIYVKSSFLFLRKNIIIWTKTILDLQIFKYVTDAVIIYLDRGWRWHLCLQFAVSAI